MNHLSMDELLNIKIPKMCLFCSNVKGKEWTGPSITEDYRYFICAITGRDLARRPSQIYLTEEEYLDWCPLKCENSEAPDDN
jgi:hypothetical protein